MRFQMAFTENTTTTRTGPFGLFSKTSTTYDGMLVPEGEFNAYTEMMPNLCAAAIGSSDLVEMAIAFILRNGSRFKTKHFVLTDDETKETEIFEIAYIRQIQAFQEQQERRLFTSAYKSIKSVVFEDLITGEKIVLDNDLWAYIRYSATASEEMVKDFNNLFLEIWGEALDNENWADEMNSLFVKALENHRKNTERYHHNAV